MFAVAGAGERLLMAYTSDNLFRFYDKDECFDVEMAEALMDEQMRGE